MVLKHNLKVIVSNCFSILVLLSLQCDYFHVDIIWSSHNCSIVCLDFTGIRNNLIDIVSKAIFSYLSQGTVVFPLGAGPRCLMVRHRCQTKQKHLARVVRKVDNAIHRINLYPVDSVVCFVNTYPLNSDLSAG